MRVWKCALNDNVLQSTILSSRQDAALVKILNVHLEPERLRKIAQSKSNILS